MALADRFPNSFASPAPEWLPSIDDVIDDDLVEVARRSLVRAMEAVEPASALPFGVDIRLVGSTTKRGELPADAAPIIAAIQSEIDAAMPHKTVKFAMAGISKGSAIIRIEPHFPAIAESDMDQMFDVALQSDLEVALEKVMKVHHLLEDHADPQIIKTAGSKPLIDSMKTLADQLVANDLDLNVKARGSRGHVYESKFTKSGGSSWVEHVFDLFSAPDEANTLSGKVVAIDIDAGSLTIRGGPRKGRVEITHVPPNVLRELKFDADATIDVLEEATTNRLDRRTIRAHRFLRVVPTER
ncbi:hypothetical protein [Gordonia sp. (in: high G+C Gram-positive bacteria)]|uniref:hypothetical protein n=1 Tax=Gordonia sp. (in: high G+C Gram-positive bacteria) TaxID=84139 RepID=UPI003C71FB87